MAVLGDGAYPFGDRVITPYRDDGSIGRVRSAFNFLQSSARMVVERLFGNLKGRWRILIRCPYTDLVTINHIMYVCCILHNMCLRNQDNFENEEDLAQDSDSEGETEKEDAERNDNEKSVKAKRDKLVKKMFGVSEI
jgi:hypothetical protein